MPPAHMLLFICEDQINTKEALSCFMHLGPMVVDGNLENLKEIII